MYLASVNDSKNTTQNGSLINNQTRLEITNTYLGHLLLVKKIPCFGRALQQISSGVDKVLIEGGSNIYTAGLVWNHLGLSTATNGKYVCDLLGTCVSVEDD